MKRLLCTIMAFAALLPTALTRAEELKVDTPMVAAVLMDVGSDTILYSSFGDAPFDVAGLVKLPAILTLAEAFDEGVIAAASEMRVSADSVSFGRGDDLRGRTDESSGDDLRRRCDRDARGKRLWLGKRVCR